MVIFNSYVSLPEGMGFVAEIDGKITFTMANLFFGENDGWRPHSIPWFVIVFPRKDAFFGYNVV